VFTKIKFGCYRGYVGIHSSGFRDFLLKPELLRAIVDSGFEHPSEGNPPSSPPLPLPLLYILFFISKINSSNQIM
jgi:hypothetical protein